MILWPHNTCHHTFLYSLSVLYSHSQMKVAVQSPTRLNYCKTWASEYHRIMKCTVQQTAHFIHAEYPVCEVACIVHVR